MNEKNLNDLLKKGEKLERKINFYLKNKILSKQKQLIHEIKGHIEKAEHNLNFIQDNLKMGYYDWCITGCYYAIYHISLALILKKGYFSKNHDATLCILIKEYYQEGLSEEDIELMNNIYINNQDILFYTQSKNEREKASYSTQIIFNEEKVKRIRQKTILFFRKSLEILKRGY